MMDFAPTSPITRAVSPVLVKESSVLEIAQIVENRLPDCTKKLHFVTVFVSDEFKLL